MSDKLVPKHDDFLVSVVSQKMADSMGMTMEEFGQFTFMLASLLHGHGGDTPEITWNDVQAIRAKNRYIRDGAAPDLEEADTATEGYNKHYHTSDFDGGLIPGILGIHDHRDNLHGGFAFACFHPATSVPQATWEN